MVRGEEGMAAVGVGIPEGKAARAHLGDGEASLDLQLENQVAEERVLGRLGRLPRRDGQVPF